MKSCDFCIMWWVHGSEMSVKWSGMSGQTMSGRRNVHAGRPWTTGLHRSLTGRMERRSFIFWLCAAMAAQVPATVVAGDGDDSGRGRGRGRGGDDDGDDNSGPGGGGDDDRDNDDDDGGDDGGSGDDSGGGDSGGDDGGGGTGGGTGGGGSSGGGTSAKGDTGARNGGKGWQPEVDPDTVVIRYADGTVERLKAGRYQRRDGTGRLVESRPASRSDRARMVGVRPNGTSELVIRIDSRKNEVETVDRRGWRELIAHGTYLLTDPNGNVVKRRAVRQGDLGRIRDLAGN